MSDFFPVLSLTIRVSGSALVLACIFGLPVGVLLGLGRFPARKLLNILVSTGMGFPPVVIGLVVYLLVSQSGPLGSLEWLFTPRAMIFAQTVLAFPLVAGLTSAAVRSVPKNLVLQIRSLGATPWQERGTVIWEARRGVFAAVLAAFGRVISEVGAVMLVGGNIAGRTRVLSTAILLETRQGRFEFALLLGAVLLGLALVANALLLRVSSPGYR